MDTELYLPWTKRWGMHPAKNRFSAFRGHFSLLLLSLSVGCGKPDATPTSTGAASASKSKTPVLSTVVAENQILSPFKFTDVSKNGGVEFRYFGAPSKEQYMTEQNGGGIVIADFDGDGICDFYLSNGTHFTPAKASDHIGAYYRGLGESQFRECARAAHMIGSGSGMGGAAGDFDNDGFPDLYQAYYGASQMWRNMGDGTFDEVTAESGVADDLWSASAAFADLNADGLLDLFVATYVNWLPSDPPCNDPEHPQVRRTCSPNDRKAQPDRLFINQGDGRFAERGGQLGVADPDEGKGLAVQILDLTGDGRLDIFVANDTTANRLFVANESGNFDEIGMRAGVAVSSDGIRGASMGVDASDYNRDGNYDLVVTNFRHQVKDLYAGLGSGSFVAANAEAGLDLHTRRFLSFGVVFQDFDLDGWADLFIANGHIWDLTSLGEQFEYQMEPSLLRNVDGKTFVDAGKGAGDYFKSKWLGRAAAYGDLDNDGDVDLVIQHVGSDAVVLRNDTEVKAHGRRLRFVGVSSTRDPLGCRVEATTGDRMHLLHVPSGGSFQASHDPRVIVPVSADSKLSAISLVWPDGTREEWDVTGNGADEVVCVEGTGKRTAR